MDHIVEKLQNHRLGVTKYKSRQHYLPIINPKSLCLMQSKGTVVSMAYSA